MRTKLFLLAIVLSSLACGMELPAEPSRYRSDSKVYVDTQPTTETSAPIYEMVVTGDLNYRTGAGTQYQSLGVLHKWDKVTCTDFDTAADGSEWCKHGLGWSNVRYLVPRMK